MTDMALYIASVETWDGRRLIEMTGARQTVIDAALRVMLDYAPAWSRDVPQPMFRLNVRRVAA